MPSATKQRTKLKITPIADRLVIQPDDEPETMRGGLYIPDTAKEKPTQGVVLAAGPGRFERGARVPMDVRVGDRILYGKYSGTSMLLGGDEVVIITASDVLAKLG
ncbi:MAG: co-chaperone GroES [Gemmatimonadales bacterium]